MRRGGLYLLALLLASVAAGCFTTPPDQTVAHFACAGPFAGPQGDDVVQLDVAILERTVGDGIINKDLWQLADESLNPELKPVLEGNGFRTCQTGSTPPPCLLDLLKSEQSNVAPRRILTRADNPTPIILGPAWATCDYDLDRKGVSLPVEVHAARCVLTVVPALSDDGHITLHFAPEVRHGASLLKPQPRQDPSGTKSWTLVAEQPTEAYPWLGWDLTVRPNEFVVVGTLLDRADTLGHRFFLHTEATAPVQRLLVIRVSRAARAEATDVPFDDHAPPLALQVEGGH